MKFSSATALTIALAVAQPVLSTVVITSPVSSTTGHGGKKLRVEWNDDGKSPKVEDWGGINVFLAAGGQDVQYKLQELDTNMSTKKSHGSWKIDDSIGPNGQYYFIRMESTKLAANNIPSMAFSARFKLSGMDGKFNSTVMSAAQGKEGSSSSTSSSGMTTKLTSTSSALTSSNTGLGSGSDAASSSSSTSTSGAPSKAINGALVGLSAIAAGVATFM